MNEEELRNKILELEELNKALSSERDDALSKCSNQENEIKVLREYNQKLFEKIPAVMPSNDADKQVEDSESSKEEKIAELYQKLKGVF